MSVNTTVTRPRVGDGGSGTDFRACTFPPDASDPAMVKGVAGPVRRVVLVHVVLPAARRTTSMRTDGLRHIRAASGSRRSGQALSEMASRAGCDVFVQVDVGTVGAEVRRAHVGVHVLAREVVREGFEADERAVSGQGRREVVTVRSGA